MLSVPPNFVTSAPVDQIPIAGVDGGGSSANFAEGAQVVFQEMNRRSTNLGYGLGVGLRRLFVRDTDEEASTPPTNATEPFLPYFSTIFPQYFLKIH